MNSGEYIQFVERLNMTMIELVKAKNHDYSDGDDAFSNFKSSEGFGVAPLIGLSLRMGDKFERVKTFMRKGELQVSGEGIEDAFRDIIGYSWLALAMLHEQKTEQAMLSVDEVREKVWKDVVELGSREYDEKWIALECDLKLGAVEGDDDES